MKKWQGFIKLEKMDFSEGWDNEGDFDDWLSNEGLHWLEDATGIKILPDTIKRQERVESFAADVVAENDTGEIVIIENQRNQTDHDHLGKLLTYAAGLTTDASGCHLVWISENIHPAHRAALDWLNTHTDTNISFFGLEISLQKFGDNLSPELKVVCSPNDWSRIEKKKATGELSGSEQIRLKFWKYLLGCFSEKGITMFKNRKPSKDNWLDAGAVISGFSWSLDLLQNEIRVRLVMQSEKEISEHIFGYLQDRREDIETVFGEDLEWASPEGKKRSVIGVIKEIEDGFDEACWEELVGWMADRLKRLEKAVGPYLRDAKRDWDAQA